MLFVQMDSLRASFAMVAAAMLVVPRVDKAATAAGLLLSSAVALAVLGTWFIFS